MKIRRIIKNRNSGFTLVELIIVLVILAILAALLVPSLLGFLDSARKRQDVVNAEALMRSIQAELSEEYGKSVSRFSSMSTDADIFMYGSDEYKGFIDRVYSKSGVEKDPFLVIFYTYKVDGADYATASAEQKHKAFTCVSMVYWREKDSDPIYYDFMHRIWEKGSPYSGDIVKRGTNAIVSGPMKNEKLRVCILDGTSKRVTSGTRNSSEVIRINNMIMKAVGYSGTLNKNNYDKNVKIE